MPEKAELPNAEAPKFDAFGVLLKLEFLPAVGGGLVLVAGGELTGGKDASNDAPNEDVGWNGFTLEPANPVG